jgi:hypothetical protein
MPASIARRLLTDISARSIAADLHFSSLGYMGGTPGGDFNYIGHWFRCYVGGLRLHSKLSNRK